MGIGLQIYSQQEELDSIMRMGSSFSNDQFCVQLFEKEGVKHSILNNHLNSGTHLDPNIV
jgi:hypothetical protein